MSPAGGGQFDCEEPQNQAEPPAIDHYAVEETRTDGNDIVIVIRYFNEPETVSQIATFSYDPSTEEIEGLDPHAQTFLNPTQSSIDDC